MKTKSCLFFFSLKFCFGQSFRTSISKNPFISFLFILLCLCLYTSAVLNFAQTIDGRIEGRVVDSINTPLSGVNISIESENLQGFRGTTTDENGYFRVFALPIGSYRIKISCIGHQTVIFENVQVYLGKTTDLRVIELKHQMYNLPEVIVAGEKFLIDPGSTAYGGNLSSKYFEELPVDRNYKSIVTLLPQANTSYYGDEANIGGGTGSENKYFVDGIEVTDPLIGATGTDLPYNFIKEIHLNTGGYNVDTRGSLGGLINAVTNSGTNEFHGSVFGFYSSNKLTGNQKLGLMDVTQGDYSDYDFGVSIGGPIILDQLWFYAAYNPRFHRNEVEVPSFGTYTNKWLGHSFAVKLNWKASDKLNFIFTSVGDPAEEDAVGNGVEVPPSSLANIDSYLKNIRTGGINYSFTGIYNFGKTFLLEGTFSRVNRHDTGEPATERGKSEIFYWDFLNDSWSGGVPSTWNAFRWSNTGRLAGTLLLGEDILNAGVEYKTNSVENIFDYHWVAKIGTSWYREGIGKGFGIVGNRILSFFIRDSWRVRPDFTINMGVRWESQSILNTNGDVAQDISLPVQPRIGIIYLPDKEGRHKLFASYGRFSQEFALFQAVNFYQGNGYEYNIDFDHDPRVDNTGGDTTYYFPHIIRPGIEGLRGQYYDEFTIGYEVAMDWKIKFGIQGVYRTLREAIDDVWLVSEKRLQICNPGRGAFSEWPRPQRDYTALIIAIERRLDERFNFLASYVLSRDYGNYEGLFDAFNRDDFPNNNLSFDDLSYTGQNITGLVPNDRTHVFKFSGSYRFPFGLVTGITFIAQSGTPLSEYAGSSVGIKFITKRGTEGRTPAVWDLNARIMYELPLNSFLRPRIILDLFHIASQQLAIDIDQKRYDAVDAEGNPVNPNPNYGSAFRYQPSMSVRLGMEVKF